MSKGGKTHTIIQLKNHLLAKRNLFTEIRDGPGGCETCGYGAEQLEVLNFDALLREIDSFAATFKKEGGR